MDRFVSGVGVHPVHRACRPAEFAVTLVRPDRSTPRPETIVDAERRRFDLLALGEAMIEFNQQGERDYLAGFGGDTSNCAIAAARLGARVAYCTQIGDDVFGEQLLALWREEGVDTGAVTRIAGAQTGLYFVTHSAAGHRFSYRRAGSAASLMTPATPGLGLIGLSRWLHVSGISQAISSSACDTVFEALARARAAGTRMSYDVNYRPALWPAHRARAILIETLRDCDLFLPGIDDLRELTGLDEPRSLIDWSHDQGARRVILKLGSRGCVVSDGLGCFDLPAHPVQAVDATGAGDCFAGAAIARLCAGDDLLAAARFATIAAALSTLGYGAVAPLPCAADVTNILARRA
jgi:2-dehydro-3-deoxygluconokinase